MDRQTDPNSPEVGRTPRWWRAMTMVVVALLFGIAMRASLLYAASPAAPAQAGLAQSDPSHDGGDDLISHHGTIDSRPMDGKVGTWVISGTEYTANEDTQIEETHGGLGVGACVEVKTTAEEPTIAVKIESQEASDCDGSDDGPGGDDPGNGDLISHYGIINSRPMDGKVGTWVISDTEYTATADTQIEEAHGGLGVGACVEVKTTAEEPTVAVKIESQEASECDGSDDGPGGDDPGDGDFSITYGLIESREQKAGTWVISGVAYTVTDDTELEEEHGGLGIGDCVAVKTADSNPTVALKIASQEAEKCNGGDGDHNDDFITREGVVVTKPVESLGSWIIGEKSFTVTGDTVLEGDPSVGDCVEVKVAADNPTVALKIEVKDNSECDGDGHHDGDGDHHEGDGDDHNGDHELEAYGRLESRPDGKVGPWVIDGVTYTGTEETELDTDFGALIPGVCVKVEVREFDHSIAREISSTKDYKCDRDDDNNAKAVLFGLIEQLPADLQNGEWVVGGITFVVSPTTELISNTGVFTPGALVRVDFTTNMSDTNFASRIELKSHSVNPCRNDDEHSGDDNGGDNGGDDNGGDGMAATRVDGADHFRYGFCPGAEGKAVGIIDSRPEGTLLGEWSIGGIPYETTASTIFNPGDDFLAGERVKVEYVVVNANLRRATRIWELHHNDGLDDDESLIVGYVDAKPDAFIGEWTINGAPFVAISDTVFVERGTLFAIGSYVVVEYKIVNDERVITKIVTYVPPGAGDEDAVGPLEVMGGALVASTATTAQNEEHWTIAGVDYVVSEATQLVGELATGDTVAVNSYTDNGQRYATMVRTQGGQLLLPFAAK